MKYVILCLLSGIAVLAITTPALAKDTVPNTGATADLPTVVKAPATAPVDFEPPPSPKNNADSLISSGAILTGFGGVFAAMGGAFFGAGLTDNENDNCYDDECDDSHATSLYSPGTGKALVGITLLSIGGSALITGVVLLSVGLAKRKKMKHDILAFDIRTKHGKLTLEPAIAAGENGGVFGLSGRF